MAVSVALVAALVIVPVLLLVINVLILMQLQHPDDKRVYLPKAVFVRAGAFCAAWAAR